MEKLNPKEWKKQRAKMSQIEEKSNTDSEDDDSDSFVVSDKEIIEYISDSDVESADDEESSELESWIPSDVDN